MINKVGLKVENNPKRVQDELLRGTGAVMADGASIFIESSNFKDKQIIVTQDSPTSRQKVAFDPEQFSKAWEIFVEWRKS